VTWRLTLDELRAHGARVALRGVGSELGYAVLAGRAEAVVDALADAGVEPGDRVALVSQGRGHDEAIALAAILCAGAVAVSLDPSSPPARLERIARGCRALVHDTPFRAWQPPFSRIELDEDGFVAASIHDLPERDGAPEGDLAAVLHTSGSTGAPKPVPIRWEGLDAFTGWMSGLTELSAGDRVLRVAELVFDLAWFDHLATFRAGATLCTMGRRELTAQKALAAAVRRLDPQVIYGVPAMLSRLVAGDGLPPSLRVICYAGEVYPPVELARLLAVAPRVVNLFGPTETNVCTFHEVRPGDAGEGSETPIGRSTPYARCRLVEHGEAIEGPGVGELIVAGPTAVGGEHATGDRVERKADGLFYFRGRIDRMVKIHGYRIEPGEIEVALGRHPWVREAAVIPREHPRLGRVLAAFVALRAESSVDAAGAPRVLRKHLRDQLAPYAVPDELEVVDALPRSVTGKIDYAALA
jgi:acyl-coenzyme A synthetase/AMP-(fatty) acid ligase